MATLKTRLENLEAQALESGFTPCRIELMAHTDQRVNTPAPLAPRLGAITRIVLVPLMRIPTKSQGGTHGNA